MNDEDSLQPTWRLWGEDKTEHAIYTVYLKKVRYHRPAKNLNTSNTDSDDEISHLEWETVRVRFVKAGSIKKLVEALTTDDGELETTYMNVFLATYRSFSNTKEILQLLLQRYEDLTEKNGPNSEKQEMHKKTLISVLHVWLDSYPEDFKETADFAPLELLLDFCQKHLASTEVEAKIRHRLDKQRKERNSIFSFNNSPSSFIVKNVGDAVGWVNYKFPRVPVKHFAEQLTRMDVTLFKKLVPHQCLGAVWSRRDKNRSHEVATVLATINQFNAVSFRVISTIVFDTNLRASDRAPIIACWIDIAQELRVLKNFSSLKAIISGLQSNSVYRLEKTWTFVPKEKIELFDELARIFSEDNNQWTQRELLMREGTAKFADTVGVNDKQLQKVFQRQNNRVAQISFGTVPYLGTFLTDLTMIDAAIPDLTSDGLVNFDKKRKEFEVLAQIKLLQSAANAYHLIEDSSFDRWFDSILVLDDTEAYQLSCQIEPAASGSNNNKTRKKSHKKNDSVASSSSSNSFQFYSEIESTPSSPLNSINRKGSLSRMSNSSSSCSSLPSLDTSLNSSFSGKDGSGQKISPEFYIIRVTSETECTATDGVCLYKSIMLSNNERTPHVVRNAMIKLGLTGSPDDYTLAQVLPDKELVLPPNANVYYAVNTAYNLNFIIRPKTIDEKQTNNNKSRGKS